MPDIKTKNVVKGTVKTIDKSAVAAERMKDAYIRTKDKAEHGVYSAEGSAEEYAADRISGCADTVTREAVRQFDKQGRRGVQSTKNNISKAKEHFRQPACVCLYYSMLVFCLPVGFTTESCRNPRNFSLFALESC